MTLRDYQEDLIKKVRESLRSHNRVLVQLPCRAGKTVMFAYMAERHAQKGGVVWFLVHRKELVDQAIGTFDRFDIPRDSIYIDMVQSVSRHLDRYPPPTLIIFDEAHHSSANTWSRIIDAFPKARIIGLTATPCRLDGKPLSDIYEELVVGVTPEWLMRRAFLSDYRYYAPDIHLDDASWKIKGSDYDMESVANTIDKPAIYGDILRYVDQSRRTIIYCPTVAFSKSLAARIKGANHVDCGLSKAEREKAINEFRDGSCRVLTNCYLVGEGLDVPECDTVILLRPTRSTALYIQQAMRCLTYYPGKEAIIYDLVGNIYRHGMPTDDREWSLSKPVKMRNPSSDKEVAVRECKQCFRVYKGNARICPYCGHDNGMTKKQLEEKQEAELKEIKKLERIQQGKATSYEQLVLIGKQRGYRNPHAWARYVYYGRLRKHLQ